MNNNQSKRRFDKKIIQFQRIDLPIITIKYIEKPIQISKRRLRLYLEILEVGDPSYKTYDNETKSQFITNIFKCQCTPKQVESICSFKQITKKKVITMNNGNVRTIKRTRWRSKQNRLRNYIHLQ